MSDWHECDPAPEFSGVLVTDTLKFIDEYKHEINYCPYCGTPAEELINDE
jgi:hypothetical protein